MLKHNLRDLQSLPVGLRSNRFLDLQRGLFADLLHPLAQVPEPRRRRADDAAGLPPVLSAFRHEPILAALSPPGSGKAALRK